MIYQLIKNDDMRLSSCLLKWNGQVAEYCVRRRRPVCDSWVWQLDDEFAVNASDSAHLVLLRNGRSPAERPAVSLQPRGKLDATLTRARIATNVALDALRFLVLDAPAIARQSK